MLEFRASQFMDLLHSMRVMEAAFDGEDGLSVNQSVYIGEDTITEIQTFIWVSKAINLHMTAMAAQGLHEWLNLFRYDESVRLRGDQFPHLRELLRDVDRRFRDEVKLHSFFVMNPSHAELFSQSTPLFGAGVDAQFGDARVDISEAGKCIATGRYTASVFHQMRAVEIAVRALAVKLGATVASSSGEFLPWGKITANIKAKIDLLPNGPVKDSWLEAFAFLLSANRGWRTKTAHPERVYTEEDALSTLAASRSFMKLTLELL
jgi:HEPN domain-containing protein